MRCELCDAPLPGMLVSPVLSAALEAMAARPAGAIVWCEGETSVLIR